MAAIDKTYAKTWDEFLEVREWAKSNRFITSIGEMEEYMIEWFYYPDLTESEFKPNTVIWCTTEDVDFFLYHNCPIELIQKRLREQYGENLNEYFIKKKEYLIGKHFKIPNIRFKNSAYMDIYAKDKNGYPMRYSTYHKRFVYYNEFLFGDEPTMTFNKPSKRILTRFMKQCKLEVGTTLNVRLYNKNLESFNEFNITIKK